MIQLFPTCIVDAVAAEAGMAAARVLAEIDEVRVPEGTTCCGQPAWNAGHAGPAAKVARTTLRALAETSGDIVVPAGSCATMMRVFWEELFELEGDAGDRAAVAEVTARTFEFSEYVTWRGHRVDTPERDELPTVYHRSCHMLRELGITDEPERLLATVAGDIREPAVSERCCGFGGLFSVKLPETSVAMADEVLDAIVATGATRVVGCDASCLMHLEGRAERRDLGLRFEHLAESLASRDDTG